MVEVIYSFFVIFFIFTFEIIIFLIFIDYFEVIIFKRRIFKN